LCHLSCKKSDLFKNTMNILDHDTPSPYGRNLGAVAGLAFVIACISIIIRLYGAWESYAAMQESDSPDAVRLADGIVVTLITEGITLIMLIVGLICQWLAFSKYQYCPQWIWRLMLFTCILIIVACIFSWSLMLLIPGMILGVHVLSKRAFYNPV
jgi:hypothetical protein